MENIFRIGIFGMNIPSHLANQLNLADELTRRNVEVIFFGTKELEDRVIQAGFKMRIIGKDLLPEGKPVIPNILTKNESFLSKRHTLIDVAKKDAMAFFQEAPTFIREEGIQLIIGDPLQFFCSTVAEHLNIPFVSLLVTIQPPLCPIYYFTPKFYQNKLSAIIQDHLANLLWEWYWSPVLRFVNSQRRNWQLRSVSFSQLKSKLKQFVPCPEAFDLPSYPLIRKKLTYVGTYSNHKWDEAEIKKSLASFPLHLLDSSKKLIYLSLGTLFQSEIIYEKIANVCATIPDVQLIIGLGRKELKEKQKQYPKNCLVVSYAPQIFLLKRASLFITHAGLNSVTEAIFSGVPMIAIPLLIDQPGNAVRIVYHRIGYRLFPKNLQDDELVRSTILDALANKEIQHNIKIMQQLANEDGGIDRVVTEILEMLHQQNK